MSYYRQPTESEGMADTGAHTVNIVYKGDSYEELKTYAHGLHNGDAITDAGNVVSWQLQRGAGDTGILTITVLPGDTMTDSTDPNAPEGTKEQNCLKDVWSLRSVRNDKSVMAYCGDSPGANAIREHVELWAKEPDAELASEFKFRCPDGSITELSENSQQIAALIAKGVESVIRFYPVLTRKRTYQGPPDDCLDQLSFVDEPPISGTSLSPNVKKPSKLSTKIGEYEWLKMQDDVEEQGDGTFMRIEAWWGIKKTEGPSGHPWDPHLYGASRWGFPADFTGGNA